MLNFWETIMQVTPLYPSGYTSTGWVPVSSVGAVGALGALSGNAPSGLGISAWDGTLAAYDAYTSFMPSEIPNWGPLYDPSGVVSGSNPPSSPPSNPPSSPPGNSGDPNGFWGSAPGWLQDLMLFAYNPFNALLSPQQAPLSAPVGSSSSSPALNDSLGLADIASSYNYDTLAANSSTPSYLLENGSVVTSQGLDLMA